MRRLPLYPTRPIAAVEAEEGLDVDESCTRCELHQDARTVCMGAEGAPGGLLVVGEFPVQYDDQAKRPFAGTSGKLLRPLVERLWKGPIAYDNALRCAPGKTEIKDRHIDACRGYLAQTIAEVQPQRILAFGGLSAKVLLGRSAYPFTVRRTYNYLLSGRYGEAVPVFSVLTPNQAGRNRFVRGWFEEDVEWALTAPLPPLPPLGGVVRVVETEDDAAAALAELRGADWTAFDTESCGAPYTPQFRLLCVGICARGSESPWSWDQASLKVPAARAALRTLLADAKLNKRGANVKFDEQGVVQRLDVEPRGVRGDVRLWRKLLAPESPADLDTIAGLVGMGGMKEEADTAMNDVYVSRVLKALQAERRLEKNQEEDDTRRRAGVTPKKRQALRPQIVEALAYLHSLDKSDPELAGLIRETCDNGEGGTTKEDWGRWAYALLPADMLLRYNGRDVVASVRLGEQLEAGLKEVPPIDRVRRLVVDSAAHAIRRVEQWGVAADRDAILAFDSYLGHLLEPVRARLAPYNFDPDSHPQVRELLFERLKLKPQGLTRTNLASTDAETLAILAKHHPVAADINRWRVLTKLRGTYAAGGGKGGMLQHLRPDGRGWRIHPSILLDGAATGRTSCTDPNLQNIPRADDDEGFGKMARDIFIAPPGFTLVQLDYSQIELRVAAMLSGDEDMISIFREGVDFHQRTAEMISQIAWGIPASAVTKAHRSMAKAVNFGILYGKTARTLAGEWGVSVDKAQSVMDAILGKFKKLAAWCEARRRESRKTGESWTWWAGQKARRRPLWRIAEGDDFVRSTAENGSVNSPIQGTANEFCVASLAEAVDWIEGDGLEDLVRLTLPVHDSLLFEVRTDMVHEVAHAARRIMLSHDSDGVPLEVDCETGLSWGSLQKYDWRKAA